MTIASPRSLTLSDFLDLPAIDESPAWEYIDGTMMQKPMGGGKYSILQKRIVGLIDQSNSTYEAFPKLRCTVKNRSIVPDIVVIPKAQIPLDAMGEMVSTGLDFAPTWIIEILSPNQSQTKVTGNILYSLSHGTQLAWLIDPAARVVFVYQPDQRPSFCTGEDQLLVLPGLSLTIAVEQLFQWLRR